MKIVVCIRQGLDGDISPFDACAYEEALRIPNAEVTLLSMGPPSVKELLLRLTRLGAKRAILLTDKVFAGADTLATAYALARAVKKLCPDLVFCGRQTLIGDTAQTGPMLATLADLALITNVMSVDAISDSVTCSTRCLSTQTAFLPALLTVERINSLRLPSILSKMGEVVQWTAADINAAPSRCGLQGSPTRVLSTFENQSGKRQCRFISADELPAAIEAGRQKAAERIVSPSVGTQKLAMVCIVGEAPRAFAEAISENIILLPLTSAETLADAIREQQPNAVLWGSDDLSKMLAAQVSAMLGLGLCADCTSLEVEDGKLMMIRPALSGSVIAKIVSRTTPAMATVRTTVQGSDIIVAAGFGVKDDLVAVRVFADSLHADLAATRKMVDNGYLPYAQQIGLTGKTVSPTVYIALGLSGAVHHIVGMQRAGTVIAVNPDKNAPIFDYADYGIIGSVGDIPPIQTPAKAEHYTNHQARSV